MTPSVVHHLGRFKCGPDGSSPAGIGASCRHRGRVSSCSAVRLPHRVRQGAEHLVDIKAEFVQRTELDCEDFRQDGRACIGELQVLQRAAGSGREEADQPLDGLGVETDVRAEPLSCRRRRQQRDGEALCTARHCCRPAATIHGSLWQPRATSRWSSSSASRSGGERGLQAWPP